MEQGGRFYLGHIGKVPVYLAFDAIFLVVLIILVYGQGTSFDQLLMVFLAVILTILLHELGHALVAMAVGMYGVSITITGLGGICNYSGDRHPKQELVISAAGPATNLLCAWFGFIVINHGGLSDETLNYLWERFTVFSLYLGIFNSLPIFPLDGGQMALSLSRMVTRDYTAKRFTLGLSFVTAIVAIGVYIALTQRAPSLLTLSLVMFLLLSAYRELR